MKLHKSTMKISVTCCSYAKQWDVGSGAYIRITIGVKIFEQLGWEPKTHVVVRFIPEKHILLLEPFKTGYHPHAASRRSPSKIVTVPVIEDILKTLGFMHTSKVYDHEIDGTKLVIKVPETQEFETLDSLLEKRVKYADSKGKAAREENTHGGV